MSMMSDYNKEFTWYLVKVDMGRNMLPIKILGRQVDSVWVDRTGVLIGRIILSYQECLDPFGSQEPVGEEVIFKYA